ncbi:hypothetical protein [Halorhabdus sp. BNX81]|uniref:hypothetical protein n=1 Tax=Halorhabdus sp. BNX81 TaxID=2980181 RepID=UPI0023DD1480|nr:hypothetical protein [Halorhabdus sp. BNX81]WEL22134.1 hypothetical protein HBNXHr_2082 [Halorhabdus sp. BNX81]
MNRRTYLSAVGVGGIASLAGCTGILAPGEDDERGEATMVVESGTNMVLYPHSPKGQPPHQVPTDYNHIAVANQDPAGKPHDFEVTVTGPHGELFDGTVRLEGPTDLSTGILFFVSNVGDYRCAVTVGDESIAETWAVTDERLSRGGGIGIIYDGDLSVSGGVNLAGSEE